MSRLMATRVSGEDYARIMGKRSGLDCSVYVYLKMLVESGMADSEKPRRVDQNERMKEDTDEVLTRVIDRLESLPD